MDDDHTVMDRSRASVLRAHLKTPRAAAIAGILLSVLMMSAFWLLQLSINRLPGSEETGDESGESDRCNVWNANLGG